MIGDYSRAKKLGEKAYRHDVAKGQYPYLPALEDMVADLDRLPEVPLGLAEIPLERIVGTRTSGRQNAFASNFMPLMEEKSEFSAKWSRLCDAQTEEGIRDPVKVYEYMNLFYVEEGNKRVSVLRYMGAVTILADVIRILSPRDGSVQSRVYEEFLDFYRVTRMFEITFSEPGRYAQLAAGLGQNLRDPWPEELLEKLRAGFTVFRTAYEERGGGRLPQTAADALLVYLEIYSLDSLLEEGQAKIDRRIRRLWSEFVAAALPEGIELVESTEAAQAAEKETPLKKAAHAVEKTMERSGAAGAVGAAQIAGAVAGAAAGITGGASAAEAKADMAKQAVRNGLVSMMPAVSDAVSGDPGQQVFSPAHPLRLAFFYEKDPERSGWAYGHELGRNHLKDSFGSRVETMSYAGCGTQEEIERAFDDALGRDCRVFFTTSSGQAREALRFAVDHPGRKVLNCSFNQKGHAVRYYYGRMFEAKYLMGALAASLSDSHTISYLASRSDIAAVSNINAFALGAQLIDPYCRIDLSWSGEDTDASTAGTDAEASAAGTDTGTSTAGTDAETSAAGTDTGVSTAGTEAEACAGDDTGKSAVRGGRRSAGKGTLRVFSDIDMIRPADPERRYGLYLEEEDGRFTRLAAPLWNWGVFYDIVVRHVLEGTYDSRPSDQKNRALNYWLGLSSGLIDVILSNHLPAPSFRLMELLKKGIIDGRIHPFTGTLRAADGSLHGKEGETLGKEEIMSMDWLCENVDVRG